MALTVTITPKELARQAAAAFEGKSYAIYLINDPSSSKDRDSTLAQWRSLEVATSHGYEAVSGTIGTGTYNATSGYYLLPSVTAQYSATGAGFTYNTVVVSVDGNTYPHSFLRISPSVTLQSGQSKTYVIRFIQDD